MTAVGGVARAAQREQPSAPRRELSRLDTVLFLISAMVVVDTVGAIATGGGEAFTWLVVLFVSFFIPSALLTAELGGAPPTSPVRRPAGGNRGRHRWTWTASGPTSTSCAPVEW
jgi:hypothetical protein